MANPILVKRDAEVDFTISLGSLATATARASDAVVNSADRGAAIIYITIRTGGTVPIDGSILGIYLLRDDDNASAIRSDGWSGTDSFFTPINSDLIGTMAVTNNINTDFSTSFDTAMSGPLGSSWGLGIQNETGESLNAAGSIARFVNYFQEIQ